MYNIKSMQISNSTNYLLEISTSLFLVNFGVFDDVIKEFTIFNILHDKKKVPTGLYYLVKLNYRWVPDKFQDMDFSRDSFHISDINDFLFHKYFNSYSFSSESVST